MGKGLRTGPCIYRETVMRIKRLAGMFLLLAGTAASAQPVSDLVAPDGPEIKALIGAWDVIAEGSGKRCRIQLNAAQPGRDMLVAGIQPPCRNAIPALTPVLGWGLGKDGRIRLMKADGKEALVFESRKQSGGAMRFVASSGFTDIVIEPAAQRYETQKRNATVINTVATLQAPSGPAVDPALAAVAGRYTVARDPKQPGCVVTLVLETSTLDKARKATLDPACTDAGLKVFDPAGWRMEGERLFLVARKGHAIGFSKTREGNFFKDPPQGKPLVMVKG
jgi:Protease inhibitor Inh